MILVTHFCCFKFKNKPNCTFKYFKSSEVIVVKKEKFIKHLIAFIILMLKWLEKVVSCGALGYPIEQTRILYF